MSGGLARVNAWGYGLGPGWDCGRCRLDGLNGLLLHYRSLKFYVYQITMDEVIQGLKVGFVSDLGLCRLDISRRDAECPWGRILEIAIGSGT